VTEAPDLLAFLEHNAKRFEHWAEQDRLNPKSAELWLAKAAGMHAVIRELRRLQRIEKLARAVNALFHERDDVIRLRVRVEDGTVDHREHFLKLRAALLAEVPSTEKAKELS
jgi:hypothetical protein